MRMGTIRNRLLVAFVLLVLLPAALIGASSVYFGLRNAQRQVINQLQSVATLKEEQIEDWLASLRVHLAAVIYPYQIVTLVEPLLAEERTTLAYTEAAAALRLQFDQMIATTGLFEEVWLLDTRGYTLLATNRAREGQVHVTQEYFWRGLEGTYTQSMASTTAQGVTSPVVVAHPVRNADQQVVAVVVGRASAQKLNAIMLQSAGLGETGETYLVGPSTLLLTPSRFADRNTPILRIQTPILDDVIRNHTGHSGLYKNYYGDPVIGIYRWLGALQIVLIAEQAQAEAFQATYAVLWVNTVVALFTVLVALVVALFMARSIAKPLANLANTATQIAAGNLELHAPIERNDEVGALAMAFNRMTARLHKLILDRESHISDLEEAEAKLARDVAEQQALSRLSNHLQRCQSLEEAYHTSVTLLRDIFPACAGALYRQWSAAGAPQLIGAWGDAQSLQFQTAHSECLKLINQAHASHNHALPAAKQGAFTLNGSHYETLCVPLHVSGESLGFLQIQKDPDALQDLASLISRVADLLALALSNLQLRENLREQAIRDPLTGLFNRRYANEVLGPKLEVAQHTQATVVVLLFDIDYFKRINDTLGHDAGDATLRAVGRMLNSQFAHGAIVCRFGGEEVLLIMDNLSRDAALQRAEQLRQALSQLVIEHNGTQLPHITVSMGVALYPEHGTSHDELVNAADQALYRAKSAGRNQVFLAECV
ncbi:MAG: diguanylate cyclase [Candidatus Viridilinea halotolerans]|uniref:Diguanylate cyclase n=1 Tax=Candidatus Viridilinea halotolerans TaxID=2491704 RepID=A0A426TXB1_9CHLR|nr:MAG: diguanylate cyclase [Candidatus Viridilinea halotolerans]